jgi:hypothetical protein
MKVRRRLEPVTGDLGRCRNLKRYDMGDKLILTAFNGGWSAQQRQKRAPMNEASSRGLFRLKTQCVDVRVPSTLHGLNRRSPDRAG